MVPLIAALYLFTARRLPGVSSQLNGYTNKNEMQQPTDITAGSGFRLNNPASPNGHAALGEERYSDELQSAIDTDGDNLTEQESALRPPKKPNYRLRNYDIQKWNLAEKHEILKTFYYSRYEKWGRGNYNAIFEKQLQKSQIDREKLEATSLRKLQSLVSVISEYQSTEDIERI